MRTLNKLDKVLDEAMELSLEQQEMLVQILKNRISKNRREQIASDALVSLAEFETGKLKIQTASEAIQELQDYLNNPNLEDV
ncbi:hypothetical protein [Geminocystis herdmanii]|uniref:hypothetical protein n=1 Tax=Geminocystis herdmanii TaxID=669359 RepID=UPI000476D413